MNNKANDKTFKLPRLYTDEALVDQGVIALSTGQAHYLNNVLRKKDGEAIRLFNGKDGEWVGVLQNLSKKSGEARLDKQIIEQPTRAKRIHLIFAPIKKNRMDWLIEKAVELGVSEIHPVLTQNTEVRKLKTERINHQILEAAEQCERLDIPTLHDIKNLGTLFDGWSKDIEIQACLERYDAQPIQSAHKSTNQDIAVLIGPEGGFTAEEKAHIAKFATPITLGEQILRSETAVIKALSILDS